MWSYRRVLIATALFTLSLLGARLVQAALADCKEVGCKFFLQKHVGPVGEGGKPHIFGCKEVGCKFFNQLHVSDAGWWGKDGTKPHIFACKDVGCKFFNQLHVVDP